MQVVNSTPPRNFRALWALTEPAIPQRPLSAPRLPQPSRANCAASICAALLLALVAPATLPAQLDQWAVRLTDHSITFPHNAVMLTGATATIEFWVRHPAAIGQNTIL